MSEVHQNIENLFHRCWSDNERICEERVTEHMLVYIFSGEMIVSNGRHRTTIQAGEAAFIRRNHLMNKVKQPVGNMPFNGVFLHLEAPFLRKLAQKMVLPQVKESSVFGRKMYVSIPPNPFIVGYFYSLDHYFTAKVHPSLSLMELKLQEVVQILVEQLPELVPVLFDCTPEWKPDLREFMNRHFTNDLSIEQFAHYTGRSLSTFKRDFAEVFDGETPARWIVKRRLREAYTMLQKQICPPSEAYLKVGFKNFSHFSNAFKRQYQVTPSVIYGE